MTKAKYLVLRALYTLLSLFSWRIVAPVERWLYDRGEDSALAIRVWAWVFDFWSTLGKWEDGAYRAMIRAEGNL